MTWQEEVTRHRRALHQIPELGFQETKTHTYLINALHQMGLDPVVHKTGISADIDSSRPGRTIALRADMDGLPLHEETGLDFASTHPGVMHACGHDGHMAILLGTVARLIRERDQWAGRVRVLFQPAEELPPGGALDLIAAGLLDEVDEILGLHLWSEYPVGTARVAPGPMMANADSFMIRVHGRGGHGSQPEATKDAVLIAAQIVVNLQTIVSRRIGAFEPAVVTCGTIKAGTTFNIIAESAEVSGTVRTFSTKTQAVIEREMRHIAETTASLYDATAELTFMHGYPVVVNDATATERWANAIEGTVTLKDDHPSMGGEDFAYYLHHRPGAFLFLGCAPDGEIFPHHSPHFLVNEASLPVGVEVLYKGARSALAAAATHGLQRP